MPIDTEGYRDFSISLNEGDVQFSQVVDVGIDPSRNGGASLLAIYNGVLRLRIQGQSDQDWRRGVITLRIPTGGRRWTSASRGGGWTLFSEGTALVSLASVLNENTANNVGWEIDGAVVEPRIISASGGSRDHLSMQARLGVQGSDSYLLALSYQVIAKGSPRREFPTIEPGDIDLGFENRPRT